MPQDVRRPRWKRRVKGPKGYAQKPVGVVIHCTVSNPIDDSPADRNGVIDYLDRIGLSVPLTVDDEDGTVMVERPYNGLHAACLTEAHGIEQVGQATWTRKQWLDHRETIENAAKETAWFISEVMGLPVTKKVLKRFVVGHVDDHKLGGCSDHWDPGPGYPWDVFYALCIAYAVKMRYRVTAVKGDRKLIRQFRIGRLKKASAWARKKAKRGYRVVIQKKKLRADLED